MKEDPPILVAGDSEERARRAARLIAEEFKVVHVSTQPERTVSDFEVFRPVVLVLAFGNLGAAQSYRDRLNRSSRRAHLMPHRTILLCGAGDLQCAYDLCKSGAFDDYVLFWPQTNDSLRLPMAIHHALHLLARNGTERVSPGQLAAHARHLASLEPNLAELAHKFADQVDMTQAAASAAERSAGGVFRRCFGQLGESVDALCDAARALAGALGPQLQGVRALNKVAERVRPTVLAVDDDAFEQTQITRFLTGTKVDLICASTGAQAFGAIWTRRPDLVLMDINLPDMSGVEVTRRLKSVELLASIPVIMVTGDSHRAVVMESLQAGAADFVVKPFCRATLLDKLEAFLPGSVT